MTYVVGIDLGGSGSRMVVSGPGEGDEEEHLEFSPSVIGSSPISSGIIDALHGIDTAGDTPSVLCIGSTGMPGLLADPERLAELIFAQTAVETVIVAGDCLTMHLGALEGRSGVVAAVGTGAIVLGTDFENTWHRVDGWGHLLGDVGSGSWVGRQGIASALAELDGRGGSPALLRLLKRSYGSTAEMLQGIYRSPSPAAQVAEFAPCVAEAAHDGDVVARAIWDEAGAQLGAAVAAASRGIVENVSWGGGLFNVGDLLLAPFERSVHHHLPGARIIPPSGGSLAGALRLARQYLAGQRLPSNEFHQVHGRHRTALNAGAEHHPI